MGVKEMFLGSDDVEYSEALKKAKKILNFEQIATIEDLFHKTLDRTQLFEIFYNYAENQGSPEYFNWRLLLDEIEELIKNPSQWPIYGIVVEIVHQEHLRA